MLQHLVVSFIVSMKRYELKRVHDCLLAQAKLCDDLATAAWDEKIATRCKQMAEECRTAAAAMNDSRS